MKIKILVSILLLSISGSAIGQVEMTNSPQWQVTIHVADENGSPVTNASTYASYYIPPPPGETEAGSKTSGLTDSNGLVTLSAHSGPAFGYGAGKEGYYSSTGLGYDFDFKNKANGIWHPWNPTLEIVLIKTLDPIPMYAKSVNLGLPVFDKPAGFDFMIGDWVEPYGKGKRTDIMFTGHLDQRSRLDYDYKLTVSFPNKGDGIQTFATPQNHQNSLLRSPHQAPDGGYEPQYVQEDIERPDKIIKHDFEPKRNYFFRVRTVLDENGNVKNALYGKIYGDFMQFKYFLNPTPNDRNIEFDTKQNLLGGLQSFEQVREP